MKESFKDIIQSERPVLIDFSAEWCGPCQMLAPELKKLSSMVDDRVRILKIDVDKNPQAAQALKVMGVPTLMVYRNGKLEWRASGYHTADQLLSVLQPLLAS
jgi:thioredoxin 1